MDWPGYIIELTKWSEKAEVGVLCGGGWGQGFGCG